MKRIVRRVLVDRGYDLEENWVSAKVVDQRKCRNLFTDSESEDLLVELPGSERVWVSFWKEIT